MTSNALGVNIALCYGSVFRVGKNVLRRLESGTIRLQVLGSTPMTAVLRLRLSIVFCCAAISLACTSVSHAQVNTTPNDSWDTDGTFNSPSPVLSSSTTGATLNTHSLAAQNLTANFWGPATFNLVAAPANREL